mmetsp:Transcript_50066/g.112746  ORF Transcript_50066/g.112746 Transcript_50066/m.112746 type:complete len:240 (-) Transcript_50066:198-917(-)
MEVATCPLPSTTTRSGASSQNLAAHAAVKRAASGKSLSTATSSMTQQDTGIGSGSLSGQGSGCLSGQASPPGTSWKLMSTSPTGGFSDDSTATGQTGPPGSRVGSERSNEHRAGRTVTRNSGSSTPSTTSLRERRGMQELKVDTDRHRNSPKAQGTRQQETRSVSKTAATTKPLAALHVQAQTGKDNGPTVKVYNVTKRPSKPLKHGLFGFLCGSWRRQQSMDSPRYEHDYDEKVLARR